MKKDEKKIWEESMEIKTVKNALKLKVNCACANFADTNSKVKL